MKNSIKIFTFLGLLLLTALISVSAYGTNGPLYVKYEEKYNISANVSGDGSTSYSLNNITGYIIINNTGSTINDTLYDVWIAVNVSNNITPLTVIENTTNKGVFITSSAPSYTQLPTGLTYIHIPQLPNGAYVICDFGIDTSITGVPVLVDESYDATKVPANRKSNWTVSINISRNVSALPDTNTAVYVNLTKYLSNDTNNYGSDTWNLLNINSSEVSQGTNTTWDGPYFSGTNDALNWTGIVLNSTVDTANINFTVVANNTYANRSAVLLPYGFAVVNFNFDGTVSGTSIKGVYASGYGSPSAIKDGPYKNTTTGEYTVWYMKGNITNKAHDYSFNLTTFNIWAINGSNPAIADPFNTALLISGSKHTYTPNFILNPGDYWNTSKLNFSFNDVPIVWANCTFKVVDSNITLINRSINEYQTEYGSAYIIVEKIYVVGSYLVKVTKHIVPNSDGTYDVYIVVENIGSEKSPLIYAYDLIPNNFTESNFWVNESYMLNISYNGNNWSGNYSVSNPRYKIGYYWALNPLNGGADGDGNYTDGTEISNNQTVVIHYTLNGTGEFYPTDLFIVGIDPTHSLLPTTSPKTVIVSGAISDNFEPLMALIGVVVGTIVIVRRKFN